MADAVATFAIEASAQAMVAAVGQGKASLVDLRSELDANVTALRNLTTAQKQLKAGGVVDGGAYKTLTAQIQERKNVIARLQQAQVEHGSVVSLPEPLQALEEAIKPAAPEIKKVEQALKQVKPAVAAATAETKPLALGMTNLVKVTGQLPGPLGQVAQKTSALQGALGGGAMALGIGLVAASIIAVTKAAITGATAIGKFAIASADASTKQRLLFSSLIGLKGKVGSFREVDGMSAQLDALADKYGMARDEVAGFAQDLLEQKVKPKDIIPAVEGIAITAATLGNTFAKKFSDRVVAASKGGTLSKTLGTIGQGLKDNALLMGNTVGSSVNRVKNAFQDLFANVNTSGLVKAINSIVGDVKTLQGNGIAQGLVDKLTTGVYIAREIGSELILGLAKAEFYAKNVYYGIIDIFTGKISRGLGELAVGVLGPIIDRLVALTQKLEKLLGLPQVQTLPGFATAPGPKKFNVGAAVDGKTLKPLADAPIVFGPAGPIGNAAPDDLPAIKHKVGAQNQPKNIDQPVYEFGGTNTTVNVYGDGITRKQADVIADVVTNKAQEGTTRALKQAARKRGR